MLYFVYDFNNKQYVILIQQRYRRTDRQTTCNLSTVICTTVIYVLEVAVSCSQSAIT